MDLFDNHTKEEIAIKRLQTYEPSEGYILAFSGGKDSIVLKDLVIKSGVIYRGVYSLTTIDPPDLVQYVKKYHSDIEIIRPEVPFLKRLVTRGFPIRNNRWCCQEYKENVGKEGGFVLTGIRYAESNKRKKRTMVESCIRSANKRFLHPVIDWSDIDIWDYIHGNGLKYCKLYDEGWKRLGCMLCPYSTIKEKRMVIDKYPKVEQLFRVYFNRYYEYYKGKYSSIEGLSRWKSGDELFDWWLWNKHYPKKDKHQMNLFEVN